MSNPSLHRLKLDIIQRHVKEDVIKGNPKMYAREMKLVNQLMERYDDPQFWLTLNPGFQLNSLAWFKIRDEGGGAADLELAWRKYQLTKPTETIPLDIVNKFTTVASEPERIVLGSALKADYA